MSRGLIFRCSSKIRHGSARRPVILPVFKTGGRQVCPVAGGFDSHSLPPRLKPVWSRLRSLVPLGILRQAQYFGARLRRRASASISPAGSRCAHARKPAQVRLPVASAIRISSPRPLISAETPPGYRQAPPWLQDFPKTPSARFGSTASWVTDQIARTVHRSGA